MAKKFSELRKKMSPAARARAEKATQALRRAAGEKGLGVLSLKEINAEIRAARKRGDGR